MVQISSWFKNKFSGKLAIFCSDERFIKASLEFLHTCLNIKHCDLIVVPGGPVFIVNKEKCLLDRLKLLVNTHKISNIILFSHLDCGYYKNQYKNLNSNLLIKQQVEDMKKSQLQLNKMFPQIIVKSFRISFNKKKIIFKFIKQKKRVYDNFIESKKN